jgi:transposase-like protein
MNSKIISLEIKSQILEELDLSRYSVSELSKIYNVSRSTIYNLQKEQLQKDADNSIKSSNFVELSVSEDHHVLPRATMHQKSQLTKAHLAFKDFSIIIEGRISSDAIFEAIKLLEISSC